MYCSGGDQLTELRKKEQWAYSSNRTRTKIGKTFIFIIYDKSLIWPIMSWWVFRQFRMLTLLRNSIDICQICQAPIKSDYIVLDLDDSTLYIWTISVMYGDKRFVTFTAARPRQEFGDLKRDCLSFWPGQYANASQIGNKIIDSDSWKLWNLNKALRSDWAMDKGSG